MEIEGDPPMMGLSLGVLFGVVVFFSRCSVGVVIRVVLSLSLSMGKWRAPQGHLGHIGP